MQSHVIIKQKSPQCYREGFVRTLVDVIDTVDCMGLDFGMPKMPV